MSSFMVNKLSEKVKVWGAFLRETKESAVQSWVRVTSPHSGCHQHLESFAYLFRNRGPKVIWVHARVGHMRAPRSYETGRQWWGWQLACHLRELGSWRLSWRRRSLYLLAARTKTQKGLASDHRRSRRGPWCRRRPLGGEGNESFRWTKSYQRSCCHLLSSSRKMSTGE